MNVQMRVHVLRTFVTHLLVHIHQRKKIALDLEIELLAGEVFDGILILYTCVGVRLEKEGRPSFKNMSLF
jgi:hypothetical protein